MTDYQYGSALGRMFSLLPGSIGGIGVVAGIYQQRVGLIFFGVVMLFVAQVLYHSILNAAEKRKREGKK